MILAVIFFPLSLALLLMPLASRPLALRLAPWAPLPALLLALAVLVLAAPVDAATELSWLLLGTRLGLDETGRVFLLFSALIWLAAGLYARVWLAGGGRNHVFFAFFLTAQAGNLGVCLAQGAAGFYFFFALMTFAAYGLVAYQGDAAARRAGRVYLAQAVVGEVLILSGLLLLVDIYGGAYLADFRVTAATSAYLPAATLCLLLGFGVKAGLPLMHYALPLAYAAAPIPAAAALAGAMLNAGVLGWLRFLPPAGMLSGDVALAAWGAPLMAFGLFAVFVGAAVGLTQRQAGALLAYSSISQIGYFIVALGAGMLAPALWPLLLPALVLYAAHHALAKTALFLGLGIVQRQGARPLPLLGMALPALALAGAPFTSGLLAKSGLKQALVALPAPWSALLPTLLTLGALATALMMLRLFQLLRREPGQRERVGVGLASAWLLALFGVAAVTAWLAPAAVWRDGVGADSLIAACWPLAGALLLAFAAARWRPRLPAIPPGDLLVLLERALAALLRVLDRLPPLVLTPAPPRAAMRSPWLEARLRTLPLAGLLWLLLLAVFIVILAV